jgi:hypothetical protein
MGRRTIAPIRGSELSSPSPHSTWLTMPSRTSSGLHYTSSFLFVNQYAASVLAKANDRRLNQSKQRHVQRQHFARKRQAQLEKFYQWSLRSNAQHKSARADSCDLNGEALNEHRPSDSSEWPTCEEASEENDAQHDLPEPSADVEFLHNASSENAEFRQHGVANNAVPRPRQAYALDPFSSTTLQLHPATPSLIHYYTKLMIPRIFAIDARASNNSGLRHQHAFQKDMQGCLTDETQMYALLASSLVHMNRFESHLEIPGIKAADKERAPLYFKTRAMASVRRQLADGSLDVGMFQVVYRLMATERCLGNHIVAKTHFRALYALVAALGGVQSLDSYNKERVIHSDLFEAAQSLRSPNLPLTWDPGNPSEETMLKIGPPDSLKALGLSFLTVQPSKVFHADMLDIISALTTLVHFTVYSWTPTADLTPDDLSWQTLRRAAIEHRLLSFPSTHNRAGDHNFIQECTRVATLFWVALYLADPIRTELVAPFNPLLRQTLERSGLQSLWYPHSALLLWIVTIGAFIAKNGDEYDWFATMAAKVATYLQVTKIADLKTVLQGFFYIDSIQHQLLAKLVRQFDKYLRLSPTQVRYYDLNTSPEGCSAHVLRDSQ